MSLRQYMQYIYNKNTIGKQDKIEYNKDTVEKHLIECPEIGVSTSSGCMMEPALDMKGDNYTMEVLNP